MELSYISTGKSFEFPFGKRFRIDDNTSFSAAQWEVERCAFYAHPNRKSHDFVPSNARMEADSTFIGASRTIVLTSISGENTRAAVVHFHGYGDFHDAVGREERLEFMGVFRTQMGISCAHLGSC